MNASPDADSRPVSFRPPPELRTELAERSSRIGAAARRDLYRYYAWLEEELRGVQMDDEDVADNLMVALREFVEELRKTPHLVTQHRYITAALQQQQSDLADLAETWTASQSRAVLDALERAWRRLDDEPKPERLARVQALADVGLLRSPTR